MMQLEAARNFVGKKKCFQNRVCFVVFLKVDPLIHLLPIANGKRKISLTVMLFRRCTKQIGGDYTVML